ncbi:MAG: RecX family transcriptional regulator [Polyangia bacterium]
MAGFGRARRGPGAGDRQPGTDGSSKLGRAGRAAAQPLDEQQLYDRAVALLSRQMRTVTQLRRLLRAHAAPGADGEAALGAALARLHDHGYLSDLRFALSYATARKDTQHFGRRRIAQELLRKGVAAEVVTNQLDTAFQDVDEDAQARAYLRRKRVPPLDGKDRVKDARDAARVFRMLLRAGFSPGTATRAVRGLRSAGAAALDDAALTAMEEAAADGADDPG